MRRTATAEHGPRLVPLQGTLDVSHRGEVPASAGRPARAPAWRMAIQCCSEPRHLKRTSLIALCVGILLVTINQLGVILAGHASTVTWLRCGLDFLVPFAVSNLGLLMGYAEDFKSRT